MSTEAITRMIDAAPEGRGETRGRVLDADREVRHGPDAPARRAGSRFLGPATADADAAHRDHEIVDPTGRRTLDVGLPHHRVRGNVDASPRRSRAGWDDPVRVSSRVTSSRYGCSQDAHVAVT